MVNDMAFKIHSDSFLYLNIILALYYIHNINPRWNQIPQRTLYIYVDIYYTLFIVILLLYLRFYAEIHSDIV